MAIVDDATPNENQVTLIKKKFKIKTVKTIVASPKRKRSDTELSSEEDELSSLSTIDPQHGLRKKIQSKLAYMDLNQLQTMVTIVDKTSGDPLLREGSTLVRSRIDGLVIAGLLIVGIVSDIFAKNEDQESFYFKLAIAIVVAVNQIDNCTRLFAIETICGSLLALDMIIKIVRQGLTIEGIKLHDDFKLLYAILVLPMMSKNISWGTSVIFLLYLCFNLWLANFIPAILAVVVAFLYQRGRIQVSRVNYERLYFATGVAFLLIIFGYIYVK